jgi:hypothetical protein
MRKDVTREQPVINDILDRAEVLWLAFHDEEGPCSMPVNFARNEDAIYIHSGRRGRKFRALCTGLPVAYSCVVDTEPKTGPGACDFSYRFKSVMGTATPALLPEDKTIEGLDAITLKHAGEQLPYKDKVVPKTAVFALRITDATARVKQ